ncbi:ABC transporter permease [Nocardioides ferulae]|uniref:ABC transporter permease n=1 Tax=Nocardioides ferulae TaxID=2340821 RepID=UPI000EB0AE3D|nr:ABC transporter permease subunit [Nocardioides ferulae]
MSTSTRPGLSPTIVELGVRSVFGRRRGVLLFVLPLVLVGLAILVRALVGVDEDAAEGTLYGLGLVVVVPLVSLLGTTGVLAPEIDDGSIAYLLSKPISRHTIVLSKLTVATGASVVFGTLPMLLAGFVLMPGDPRFVLGFALAALLAGVTYCVVFALASMLNRHAVVIGLIYVLVWEGLLGGLLSGVRWLSVTQWAAAVGGRIVDPDATQDLSLGYALVATVVVLVGGTWWAGRRLRSFNIAGEE